MVRVRVRVRVRGVCARPGALNLVFTCVKW